MQLPLNILFSFMCRLDGSSEVKSGPQPWHSCHKMIYVRPNPKTGVPIGHWPIPESFWPDQNSPTLVGSCLNSFFAAIQITDQYCNLKAGLEIFYIDNFLMCLQPPRLAHPQVRFLCVEDEPMVIDKVPFDKYELEPSPLTQYILERKSPHTCWQVKPSHFTPTSHFQPALWSLLISLFGTFRFTWATVPNTESLVSHSVT